VCAVLGEAPESFASAAKARPAADLLRTLESAGVPCDAVVLEDAMNRFMDNPLNRELGLIAVVKQPLYGDIEQPGEMRNFGDVDMNITRACPTIGQHTDEIMREMGYSDGDIAAFREAGVIG
jgi:crotonobetainyl-CoA:carnitine CoA-transferase CaiB-like acyl-CoA transferase